MGLTLRVDREPEDPRKLAVQLAEALQGAADNKSEAETLRSAAKAERSKAMSTRDTMVRVREYRRSTPPDAPRRRMDPMAEYDLSAMETERQQQTARAEHLRTKADEHEQESKKQGARVKEIQLKINVLRKTDGRPQ